MAPGASLGVVRGALVRVLAVREVELLLECDDERVGERLGPRTTSRSRRRTRPSSRTPSPRAGVRVSSETPPSRAAPRARLVVGSGRRRRDVTRSSSPRARSIDGPPTSIISRVARRRCGDLLERIEVDADEVERLDPVLGERRPCRRPRRGGRGCRRGCAGGASSRGRRASPANGSASSTFVTARPRLLEVRGGAARGDERPAELGEAAREVVEAGLVVDGDQRAHSSPTTSGSSRCSTAWTRARSDSTRVAGSTGTGSAG